MSRTSPSADHSHATGVAGSRGEQFAPDARPLGTTGGSDKNIVRPAAIHCLEFQFVRMRILVSHVRPKSRLRPAHEFEYSGQRRELDSGRLMGVAELIEGVADHGAIKLLAHHREGDFGCLCCGHHSVPTGRELCKIKDKNHAKVISSQTQFDCQRVTQVKLNLNCRDEIVPILRSVRHGTPLRHRGGAGSQPRF